MDSIHGTQTLGAPKPEIICRRQWVLFIETRAWEPPSRPAGDHAPMLESDGSCYRSNKKKMKIRKQIARWELTTVQSKKGRNFCILKYEEGETIFYK
jgi:hypothetical protein